MNHIVATSDLHGTLTGLSLIDCDIAIIAGDFAKLNGGGKWHWNDQKKWIQKKFIPFIESFPKTQFCIVPGNHDMVMDSGKTSLFPDLDFKIEWPENAHVLIDEMTEIKGLKIYGTPWIPIISYRWAFESESEKLKERFSKIPYGLDILITHTPPHIDNGCGIDRSLQLGGYEAFGSVELANEILEKKPRNVVCGHIHSGTHLPVHFANSVIYNVSRVDEDYEVAYEPTILDL